MIPKNKILEKEKRDSRQSEDENNTEGEGYKIQLPGSPKVFSRDNHCISRKDIDQDALKVLRRLHSYGYQAFLVGGGVRDLLVGKNPKDFDICTDATPEDIRELFRNSRVIGKRFKIAHVYFYGGKIIEVATFRAEIEHDEDSKETLPTDNTFGTAETDAIRRDLTINALFYSSDDFSIIDYVGGMEDLKKKIVKIIGDPDERFIEDPVRIIRAARHAARLGFTIEKKTEQAMLRHASKLKLVPTSRIYEELLKDFYSGSFLKTFLALGEYGVIKEMLPKIDLELEGKAKNWVKRYLGRFNSLDTLVNSGVEPGSEVFLACLVIGLGATSDYEEERGSYDSLTEEDKFNILVNDEPEKYLFSSDDSEDDSVKAGPVFRLKPFRRDRNSRDRVSGTARVIGKWFEPCSLTKREKFALERLLVLRFRLRVAIEDEANKDNLKALSELLKSIHEEERENLRILLDILDQELPKAIKALLQSPSREKRRYNTRPAPNNFKKNKPVKKGVPK
jgi:poly(A) polymerase